jgi:hypothetical protein
MLRSLFTRRGAVAVAAATIGVASMTMAVAASAASRPDKPPAPTYTSVSGSNADGSVYTTGGSATLTTANYAVPTGDTAQVLFVDGSITTIAPITGSSATAVTVTAPAESAAGTVAVTLEFLKNGKLKTTVGTHNVTYEVQAAPTPAPVVTGVTPNTGSTLGGTTVTISGDYLSGETAVKFGANAATGVSYNSGSGTITATSPAGTAGGVDVTVTTPSGTSETGAAGDTFTYQAPGAPTPPAVTAVSPNAGIDTGGQTVTITGTNFTASSTVDFVNATITAPATVVGTPTSTSITVTTPNLTTATGFVTPATQAELITAVEVLTAAGNSGTTENAANTYTFRTSAYLPPATLIIGSGSATTYTTMIGLGDLFEQAPGCDLTNTTDNQVGLDCTNATGTSGVADTDGLAGGQAGLPVGDVNPLDDYVAEAPATGSGNGRTQLTTNDPLTAGPDGISAFNISFARSSSYSKNSALNYVGWGTDGVSWVALNTVAGTATGHQDVTTISKTNLQAIWENTLSCTIPGVTGTVSMDWRCLEQAQGVAIESGADPIDCYTTQTASGTYSTWQGYLGFTKNVNPPCSGNEAGDPGDSNAAADHNNLTENTMGVVGNASDAANAIYFFSYGKFVTNCTADQTDGQPAPNLTIYSGYCPGTPSNTVTQFGGINGIYATQHTIQGNGDTTGVTFPDPRVLYNVYANSTAANPANAATLNFIGSTGFLCRDTTADIDPTTGVSYRKEIEQIITSNGFLPLDISNASGVPVPFAQTSLANVPANEVGPGTYYPADVLVSNEGFCANKN